MPTASTQAHASPQAEFPVAQVPRINIHTFCDNQQTAETMQAAAMDRRMSKAHVTIQLGGIPAAVQVYHQQATPNVLIVESHGSREAIMSELGHLAQVCQPNTKVIVVGHLNDVILYRELIQQGISEYLVAPLSQVQIIETDCLPLSGPEVRTARQDHTPSSAPRVASARARSPTTPPG